MLLFYDIERESERFYDFLHVLDDVIVLCYEGVRENTTTAHNAGKSGCID